VRPGRAFTALRVERGALALCCGALIALSGCGGSDSNGKPIPAGQSNRMIALTRLADQQSADGRCGGAQAKVREAQSVLDQVPSSVDKSVRDGLAQSYDRLLSLIQSECQRPQQTQTQTTQTHTSTTPSTTTPTTTTPTTTTPTTTTPSTTTPTTTTPTTTTPTTTTPTSTNGGAGPPSGDGGAGQG
jgi:hypothetical protein